MNISYSAISTFKQCRYKYKKQYVERIESDTHYFRIGSSAHESINEYLTGKITLEDIDKRLDEIHYENFKKMIENNNNVFDDNLQEQFANEVSQLKEIMNENTYKLIISNLNLNNITNYKSEELILIEDLNHDITYKGFIDLMYPKKDYFGYRNDESFVIIDFKTSRNIKYIDWTQFEFYAFLVHNWFKLNGKQPPLRYEFILYFLRYNIAKNKYFNPVKELDSLFEKIFNIAKTMYNEKDFKPTTNRWCNYCHLKNDCPLYTKLYKKEFGERNEQI